MKKNSTIPDDVWIKNCPITEIKLIPHSEMPSGGYENSLHNNMYTYRAFDNDWLIRISIHTDNLPLTSFVVSNGVPCVSKYHSKSSLDENGAASMAY